MTTYTGVRAGTGVIVLADGAPLCPRLDLHPLSASGFDWGYPGPGASQLALAILADHWPLDENRALRKVRRFMREVVAKLPTGGWSLTSEDIDRWRDIRPAIAPLRIPRVPAEHTHVR